MTEELKLTKEYFEKSGYEELIAKLPERELFHYNGIFLSEATKAGKNGDTLRERLFRLLGDVTGMSLKSDDIQHPFHSMFAMEGKRSAIPEDFTDQELDYFEEILPVVTNQEIKVRIADVLWVRKRNYKYAESAIDGYVGLSSNYFDPKNWVNSFHYAERAFNIAITLGGGNRKFDETLSYIEMTLNKLNGEDPLYFSEKLMNILCTRRLGDPAKYTVLSGKLAINAQTQNDFDKARVYWERKAKWDEIAKNDHGRKSALEKVAECFIKEAELRTQGAHRSYMVASTFLHNAIEVYRKIGGMKDKIDDIHLLMLDYEKKSLDELGVVSAPLDLTDVVELAVNSVKGKSFQESVFQLALSVRVEKYSDLKKRIEQNIKNYPIQYIFQASILNEKGKVVGKKRGLLGEEKDGAEAAMYSHLITESQYGYHIDTLGSIEPIRKQILREHNIQPSDLDFMISYNGFIPEGREALYVKGIIAGFEGDFVTATHILVPQLENSLRYVYEQKGLITSSIDSEGIQKELDINELLYREDTIKIFGEDITFHLQSLLVASEGPNIRNRMAHGLFDYYSFYGTPMIYFWGLLIKILCWPLLVKK